MANANRFFHRFERRAGVLAEWMELAAIADGFDLELESNGGGPAERHRHLGARREGRVVACRDVAEGGRPSNNANRVVRDIKVERQGCLAEPRP